MTSTTVRTETKYPELSNMHTYLGYASTEKEPYTELRDFSQKIKDGEGH